MAVVEQHLVGGECSYYACMPSKALLRPGELLAETRRVPGSAGGDGLDVAAVLARRDEVIHDLDDSSQVPWLEERGVSSFAATPGSTASGASASATTCSWLGEAVIVATGSGPVHAADPGPRRGAAVGEP